LFFVAIFLIALLAYFLVSLVMKQAHVLDLLDVPNERSHHCSIIPSGGGLGFVAALFVGFFVFEFSLFFEHWYIFVALGVVFGVGVYDDRHDVSARLKFIAIFIAVLFLSLNGLYIDTLGNWYGFEIGLLWWIGVPFSMFAIAGFTNALNLIDGIDGLASSISITILLFFAFLGLKYQDTFIVALSFFTIASILGFLLLNWNPAKIFMGDSGSLSLGFIISVVSVLSLEYIHPVAVLYLAAIPLLDTLVVMVRRIRRGKSPFSPDKTHIHHILVNFFEGNAKRVVYFLVMLQAVFSGIGYVILDSMSKGDEKNIPLFGLIGFALLFVLFYMIFTGMQRRQMIIDSK